MVLKKIPKISFLLLIATYGVFGWIYGSWIAELEIKTLLWYQLVQPSIAIAISYGLGLLCIFLIIIFFTAPMALFTLGMSSWFRADSKAILAIAVSIIIFAIIIEHPAVLTRFLILSATAMLFRLDLQTCGFSRKVAQLILIFCSFLAFTVGMLLLNI